MSKKNKLPLPLTADGCGMRADVDGEIGKMIGIAVDPRHAAEIVRRVNAFDEMLAVLRSLEWAGSSFDEPACPDCHSEKHEGHGADCRLAAAIRKATA